MRNKRQLVLMTVLTLAGLSATSGSVCAGPISGTVCELDGTTPVTDFEVLIFKNGFPGDPVTVPITFNGNKYSFTVAGSTLPAGNKSIRIEFVRGGTKRIVSNVNGNLAAAQVIHVTIGPRTTATAREADVASCSTGSQRCGLFCGRRVHCRISACRCRCG